MYFLFYAEAFDDEAFDDIISSLISAFIYRLKKQTSKNVAHTTFELLFFSLLPQVKSLFTPPPILSHFESVLLFYSSTRKWVKAIKHFLLHVNHHLSITTYFM